jgi:hypothetical protein
MTDYLKLVVDNSGKPQLFVTGIRRFLHNDSYGCLNITRRKDVTKFQPPSQSYPVIVERRRLPPK